MLLRTIDTPQDPLHLARGRVHEAGGPGRRSFALMQAARTGGLVIWIQPAHVPEHLMPWNLPQRLVHRIITLRPASEPDLLWSVEECLRSTAPALVIAEPQKPLSLTAGRRLQLAAETGRTTGLMLIQKDGGSNATQTRWHCAPAADDRHADSTLQSWALSKNKSGTLGSWRVSWDDKAHSIRVVSASGERSRIQDAPL